MRMLMDNIYFSYSLPELSLLVEHISKRLNQSSVLQNSGLQLHHATLNKLNQVNSYENDLLNIINSRYLICLLADSAISDIDAEKRIEHEIHEAINHDLDVFVFIVGEHCDEMSDIPKEMIVNYRNMTNAANINLIKSNDFDHIANVIIKMLEDDVWKTFGENELIAFSDDILHVSGFPRNRLPFLPDEISQQLAKIYLLEEPNINKSPLNADMQQRKKWAYQSMEYGHIEEAANNLEKVIEEKGSDFFSCFWLGRLYGMYSESKDLLEKSFFLNEMAVSMLGNKENFLKSICYTQMAVAAHKMGDLNLAKYYFEKSTDIYQTYDAYEYWAHLCLQQIEETQNPVWIERAAEYLMSIKKLKLSYFFQLVNEFEQKYPHTFPLVNKQLYERWNNFLKATQKSTSESQCWALKNFDHKYKEIKPLMNRENLFESSLFVSQLIWLNYRALKNASESLLSKYRNIQKEKVNLENALQRYEEEEVFAVNQLHKSNETISLRGIKRNAILKTKVKLKKERKKSIYQVLMFVLFAGVFGLAFIERASIGASWTMIAFCAMLTSIFYNQRQFLNVKSVNGVINSGLRINTFFNGRLVEHFNAAENTVQNENSKKIFRELKSKPDLINPQNIESARENIVRISRQDKGQVIERLQENNEKFTLIKQLVTNWCHRVDKFEQYCVTAHNGQFNHLLCKKTNVCVSKKADLISDSLYDFFELNKDNGYTSHGRTLHVDGSRLKAWFNDDIAAKSMFNGFRLGIEKSQPVQIH